MSQIPGSVQQNVTFPRWLRYVATIAGIALVVAIAYNMESSSWLAKLTGKEDFVAKDQWITHKIPRGKMILVAPLDGELDMETSTGSKVIVAAEGVMFFELPNGEREEVVRLGDCYWVRVKAHTPGQPTKYTVEFSKYRP